MKKYIHIGYPKNFSTSLQRDYFSSNRELFHLGIGLNDNLGYYDKTINKIFEVYLKTCKTFQYEKQKESLISHIKSLIKLAQNNNYKAFGASSEHLSFAFTYDGLSADIKAKRLFELMGSDTSIILILRNQVDIIKSLFRESVRVGFKGDYNYYLYLFYKYQDRNYYSDLNYDWVYKQYVNWFGKENVHVLFFEHYRQNGQLIFHENEKPLLFYNLDTILGLDSTQSFNHYNEALNQQEINNKIQLNLRNSHDLGNHLYESAEKHRIKQYLEDDLDLFEEETVSFEDVITKRKLLEESKKSAVARTQTENKELSDKIIKNITNDFEMANSRLKELLKTDLPKDYISSQYF